MRAISLRSEQLRSINLNFATVEEELYKMLKRSLSVLKEEVNYKTKVLLSTELEFRRQLEQLDNAEQWMDTQRVDLPETDFLQAWKLHTQVSESEATNMMVTSTTKLTRLAPSSLGAAHCEPLQPSFERN